MPTDPPPFPASVMAQGDGTWKPARGQKVVVHSTEQGRADAVRQAYRRAQERSPYVPQPREERAPRVQVMNADGSVPAPAAPPLMPHMAVDQPHARGVPLRPPGPAPMGPEQQRACAERLAVQGAWAAREADDAADALRREAEYWRLTTEAGRQR